MYDKQVKRDDKGQYNPNRQPKLPTRYTKSQKLIKTQENFKKIPLRTNFETC